MPDDPTPALAEAAFDPDVSPEAYRALAQLTFKHLEPHSHREVPWQDLAAGVGVAEPDAKRLVGVLVRRGYLESGTGGRLRLFTTRLKAFGRRGQT